MKLAVDGVEYDVVDAISKAALGDLLKLKVKTKTSEFPGVTVKTIQKCFTTIGDLVQSEDFDVLDLLGDEDFLINMTGLIYLARRQAGEHLEVSDAAAVSFSSVEFIMDDDEVVEAPKGLTTSVGDAVPVM